MQKKCLHQFSLIIMVLLSTLIIGTNIYANNSHQGDFVNDKAKVLSHKTIHKIDKLNDDWRDNLREKPQYAVITINHLPEDSDIDDYTHDVFNELGVGQKGLDNGLLFVIAVKDRKYRLEVGYGLENIFPYGKVSSDIITSGVIKQLKQKNFDQAIQMVTNNVNHVMINKKANLMSKKKIQEKRKKEHNSKYNYCYCNNYTRWPNCFGFNYFWSIN
ncbi:hypothetical protein GSH19_03565 [Lactobacillus sp. S2-2]|uniref:TPM domain-containing protein n=1 Tax=Lactobacillus sp. S2-2 TaxID=2692917 RepID=UPI001F26D61A|nr:TPM domain-containing protein [Lactobacillus sp. S2-2]MCF6515230.1 hypothetical protein [Lactobacillus sp. S2-2]